MAKKSVELGVADSWVDATKEEFKKCIDLMAVKEIDVTKFISEIVGLEQVQESYEKLISGTSDVIKILVDPNEDNI